MFGLFKRVAVFIQASLDVVLPRKERVVRTETYSIDDIVVSPSLHEASGAAITSLLTYRDPIVQDLIRAVKYDGTPHAARLLADVLAEYLREEVAAIRSFSTKPIILIPIPLHPKREQERGFNQVEIILNQLPLEFRDGTCARIARDILTRVRETESQTHLSRDERLRNMRGAFAVSDTTSEMDMHAFVIDDVTTTGATLAAAVRPLTPLNISTLPLAIAKA
jgi:ComF family protein